MDSRVEGRGSFATTGKTLHPDAVGDEKVVKRSYQRVEEYTDVSLQLVLRQDGCGLIDAPVGPLIVGREHREVLFHLPFCPS